MWMEGTRFCGPGQQWCFRVPRAPSLSAQVGDGHLRHPELAAAQADRADEAGKEMDLGAPTPRPRAAAWGSRPLCHLCAAWYVTQGTRRPPPGAPQKAIRSKQARETPRRRAFLQAPSTRSSFSPLPECVCACVCICMCVHVYVWARVCVCMYVRMHACVHACMHTFIFESATRRLLCDWLENSANV